MQETPIRLSRRCKTHRYPRAWKASFRRAEIIERLSAPNSTWLNVSDHGSQPPGTRTLRNASVVDAPSRVVGRGPRPETKRTPIG